MSYGKFVFVSPFTLFGISYIQGADPTLTDSEDYEPLHYVAAGGGGGSSGMGVGGGFRIARLLLETEQIDIDACSQVCCSSVLIVNRYL